ncbi:unnamed protein product [Dovyalis caffra]|uniref:Uncharacterized protein n=1 Tax=Dovyalis caffra TaxID=77055 RepID=A0AAV1RU61_9ROSI|nr:unnamed protein product [Dovyalis caffra]
MENNPSVWKSSSKAQLVHSFPTRFTQVSFSFGSEIDILDGGFWSSASKEDIKKSLAKALEDDKETNQSLFQYSLDPDFSDIDTNIDMQET